MKVLLSSLACALLLCATLIITPLGVTQETTGQGSEPIKFGMGQGSVDVTANAGAKIDYETFWVGPWTLKHGWGGPDSQMASLRSKDVTPAIHYYYWGDDISPDCVENGCWSDLHGAWKDRSGWQELAQQLVDHLDAQMQGDEVIIFLETEFNKGGISSYEPFDGYLAEKAAFIKENYPNAKVVLPFGNWNKAAWGNFDRAAEASDMVGIQGMRGSTRDSYSHYRDLFESTVSGAEHVKSLFAKPVMVHDIALSSYPEPEYLEYQRAELQEFFDGLPRLKAIGVEAMIYRSWYNANMDLNNYYGMAERYWGFAARDTGDWKPAASVWIDGIKAERANSAEPTPPGEAPPLRASFRLGNANEWWVETYVTASNPIATVEAQVNGGSWTQLAAKNWGSHAKSYYVQTGSEVVFRVTDTHGQTAQSGIYDWMVSNQPREPAYQASFRLSPNVNEWWVEVYVEAGAAPATVAAQVDGGSWTTLGKSSWGAYTKSFHVPRGSDVVFRAANANGQAAMSETYNWMTPDEPANQAPTAAFTATADGLSVSLDGSGSADGDGDALSYAWTLGDGTTASGRTVDHTYADGGTYTVTLTVDDGEDNAATTKTVQVTRPNRAPQASFEASASDLTVSFDASATTDPDGDPLSYSWTFGDGNSGIGTRQTHSYAEAGTYAVTLNVRDVDGATDSITRDVTVVAPNRSPVASFTETMDDLTGRFDASASSDPDGDPLTYRWDFGDGNTGTGVQPVHSYATGGTYTVTLSVTDPRDGAASAERTVSANRAPVSSFTATMDDLTGFFDASASTDPDGDPLTYRWDFGDGNTGTGVQPVHSYATGGTYTVTLSVTDPRDGAARAERTVSANRAPVSSFTATMDDLTGSFDASASADPDGDALTYRWDFGDGQTGTGVQSTHSYATGGTYTVTLSVSDPREATASAERTVAAVEPNRAPTATFTATMDDLAVTLDARASSDPDGDPLTYTWDFGDGDIGSGVQPSHTYAQGGTYTIRLQVDDGDLSSDQTRSVSASARAFTASFHPSPNMNDWWVETRVTASSAPALVEARADQGPWQTLSATRWNSYAKSFHVPPGATLTFRATDAHGQSVESAPYPTGPAFDATFKPRAQNNEWWIEAKVDANTPIAKVEVQRNGGAWQELPKTSWGNYAKSIHAPAGTSVVFRATDTNGQTDLSERYRWG